MSRRSMRVMALTLAAPLMLVVGCKPRPVDPGGGAAGSGAGGASGAASGAQVTITDVDHGKCESENTPYINPCVQMGSDQVCHVYVGMAKSGKPYVRPFNIVAPPMLGGTTTVVWHLVDADLVFKNGHGPHDWNKPGQFKDGMLTDDPDGASSANPPAEARRYRVTYVNDDPAPKSNPHKYKIKFRQGNKVHKCDPIIINTESN